MPTSSPKAQRQAALMERERLKLERFGVRSFGSFGLTVRTATLKAYRDDRMLGPSIRTELARMTPLVIDSMIASHLMGRYRVMLTAGKAGLELSGDALELGLINNLYKKVIAFLTIRLGLRKEDIDDLRTMYGANSATVTGGVARELEAKVGKAVAEATTKGLHVRDGTKLIQKAFDAAGVTPDNSYTVENIFRTQTALAYGAGRANGNARPEIQEILWGYEYTTVGDDRVRETHAAMDGVRRPNEDPIWQTWTPPCGYSCRCSVIEIFHTDAEATPTAIPDVQPDEGWAFNPGDLFRDTLDRVGVTL